jgi:hypothetical protein
LSLIDDVKIYLPKYLSDEQQENLYEELKAFPQNIDNRFYTQFLKDEKVLFQGDAFMEVPFPNFQDKSFKSVKGFLLSNTCDSNLGNRRMFDPFITFAPLFSLRKYEKNLLGQFKSEKVQSHIEAIRDQKITSFFFLPKSNLYEEMFVRFDCAFSVQASKDFEDRLLDGRMFTLSNYAFYLLLVKLGIHLSRVQEKIDRDQKPD